jgi:hypothetical protein
MPSRSRIFRLRPFTPVRVLRRFGTFAGAKHARQAAETLRAVVGEAERQPLGPAKSHQALKKTAWAREDHER